MVVKEHGERRGLEAGEKLYNHVDLVQLLDIVDLEAGTAVAGGQGRAARGRWSGLRHCCVKGRRRRRGRQQERHWHGAVLWALRKARNGGTAKAGVEQQL